MKPAQIAVICVAAVAAIGLAIVVRMMWPSAPPATNSDVPVVAEPSVQILVAAVDLQPGHRVVQGDLTWKAWPASALNPLYITDGTAASSAPPPTVAQKAATTVADTVAPPPMTGSQAEFVGAVVRESILQGEPIVAHKVIRAGDSGYLAAFLEPGMKAMAIEVSVVQAAGGFILPGDRVDVILSREVKDKASDGSETTRNVVTTVMRNIGVLALDQSARPPEEGMAVIAATATLAVTGPDAEVLALARAEGELSLVLRSYADTSAPSGRVRGAVVTGGARRAVQAGDASGNPSGKTVTIYRQVQPEVVPVS